MFKNYFIVAVRNLWRNKIFSLINIVGLAIGISAALIIFLIVRYEFSFEKFQQNRDRIFRVVTIMQFPEQSFPNGGVPVPVADAVTTEGTGVKTVAPFHLFSYDVKVTVPAAEKNPSVFKEQKNIIFTDSRYFKLLSYNWIAGAPAALNEPYKLVLTKARAKLYFPELEAQETIGRQIIYNDSIKTTIAGIVNDLDEITDFNFKEFISLDTREAAGIEDKTALADWSSVSSSSQLFIELAKNTQPAAVEKQIATLRTKYAKEGGVATEHRLQPLSDLHFNSTYNGLGGEQGNKATLYGLMLVGLILLVLGGINFINLTTAQAIQRAKEIGIRKTMGSSRRQLVTQFLGETFLLTLIATIVSVVVAPALLRVFEDFIPAGVHFNQVFQPGNISFIVLLVFLITVVAGFYPSIVLSRYKPVQVLKNQSLVASGQSRKALLRKVLIVAQFAIAQVFIIATIIVVKQIQYSLHKDLGYKKDAIINFSTPWNAPKNGNQQVLLNKLKTIPGIAKISLAGPPPASYSTASTTMKFNDGKTEKDLTVEVKVADSSYFDVYQMKLVAGSFLQPSDTIKEYLVNETLAKQLGFQNPTDAVGKQLLLHTKYVPIVGILADFNTKSLHEKIPPLAYSYQKSNSSTFHVALLPNSNDGSAWRKSINSLVQAWKEVYPAYEFDYKFYDETIAGFYKKDQQISKLLGWATGLSIIISCLGLLGLVIYSTTQRTKEISIRKILGASISQLLIILSKDFVRLVMLAFLIAIPIAWWTMNKWLENFAYRTAMSWWVFAGCAVTMTIIALLTLSIQTIRTALSNPVENLRTE